MATKKAATKKQAIKKTTAPKKAVKKVVKKAVKKTTKKTPAKKTVKAAAKKTTFKNHTTRQTSSRKAATKKAAKKQTTKATEKSSVKNTSSKKTATKTPGMKMRLRVKKVISPEQCFWINHGPILHTLDDLIRALNQISDEQYLHHARSERGVNDFAEWVRHVFDDIELARKIQRSRSRSGTRRVIVAHVSFR